MAESYPTRERYWSHRFCRLLTKLAVANEIGVEACWMLTVIAHQEDAKRYRGPVTYFNEQLMPLCGIMSHKRLIRVRNLAIKAGWLHYEPGGKGRAGRYWCVIPEEFEVVPDGPMDEGTPADLRFQNASANEEVQEELHSQIESANVPDREIPLAPAQAQVQRKCSANGNHSSLCPSPSPKDKEISAGAEICGEPDEASALPPPPKIELTEYEFPCKGKAGILWTLPKAKMEEYLEAYPDLDIPAEMRKARQWCRDNPKRRKTPTNRGMLSFLTSWLNRAQNTNRGKPNGQTQSREQRQIASLERAIAKAEQRERNAQGPDAPSQGLRGLPGG